MRVGGWGQDAPPPRASGVGGPRVRGSSGVLLEPQGAAAVRAVIWLPQETRQVNS